MMSRVDEALRRAGTLPSSDDRATNERGDLFVAPWSLSGDDPALRDRTPGIPSPGFADLDADGVSAGRKLRVVHAPFLDALKTGWAERLSGSKDCDPGLSEEFRQLAGGLLLGRRTDGLKTLLVTSAAPADGKTLVSLNLALVLSRSYRHRVLLIDADLRRPSVSQALNITTGEGLSEGLRSRQEKEMPLLELSDTLTLLPSGRPDPDPLAGLASPRMQKLIEQAAERFDWVIVDTPPVGAAADAGLLCPMVNGAVLVIRAGWTPYKAIQRAVEALGRERILGVVLNGLEHQRSASYYNYYYGHPSGLDR